MFDEKDYKAVFSKVTASQETHRRIMNMANEKKKHHTMGILSKGLIAAVMVSMLVVTASASEIVRSWFADYISVRNDVPLTTEQMEYIEENEKTYNQMQTQDGFTIELKSAITDGNTAYICLGLTAQENVVLNATTIEGYAPLPPQLLPGNIQGNYLVNQNGESFLGYSRLASVEDYDGLNNTHDMVIQLSADADVLEDAFGNSAEWTLRFENITATYINAAYQQELLDGKYKGQDNFFFTEDESELLYPKVTLAEGVWEFTFQMEKADTSDIDLIQQSVTANVCYGRRETEGKMEKVYKDVDITSFVLRSLSAVIYTNDDTFAPDFTAEGDIYVVMKDGGRVRLISEGAGGGQQDFRAEAPIPLDEVDHVLLADGTKLPMPE